MKRNGLALKAALFCLSLAALAWVFRAALAETWASWQTDEYSHGYLIPVIALVFALNHLGKDGARRGKEDTAQTSWAATSALCAGLALHFVFEFAGIKGFQPHIFVACVLALFGAFFGVSTLKGAAGPLGLLFLAVPLPKFLYYILSFNMQVVSTSLGTVALQALGIPVFQDGNILDLGSAKLQVAEACNGLRYFFPLVSLGYIFAYLYKAPLWKRAFVFLSTAPIAVLMNSLRIAFIGVTVSLWGPSWAEGAAHDIEGFGVFLGCCLLMMAEIWLLKRMGKPSARGRFDLDCFRLPDFGALPAFVGGKVFAPALAVIATATVVGLVLPTAMSERLKPVPLSQSLETFPLSIKGWSGTVGSLDTQALALLGTNDYFIGDYRKQGIAAPINLYILYYASQDVTTNQAVHSPLACIPGGGWKINARASVKVSLPDGRTFPVNALTISKGLDRQLVYYLYMQNGEPILDAFAARLLNIRNAVMSGTTSGAMIRFVTPLGVSESEGDARARLDSFLADTLGVVYGQLGWSFGNK